MPDAALAKLVREYGPERVERHEEPVFAIAKPIITQEKPTMFAFFRAPPTAIPR